MSHGLTEQAVNAVQKVFGKYEEIESAILFGSRALGTYKNGSDIDLALEGSKIDLTLLFKIELDLDDLIK